MYSLYMRSVNYLAKFILVLPRFTCLFHLAPLDAQVAGSADVGRRCAGVLAFGAVVTLTAQICRTFLAITVTVEAWKQRYTLYYCGFCIAFDHTQQHSSNMMAACK